MAPGRLGRSGDRRPRRHHHRTFAARRRRGKRCSTVTDWSVRLGFFVGIGAFVAVIVQRWRAEATRAMRLAHREQDLAMRESIFLQSISHELRSPLTVIMGVVYTLEQRAIMSDAAEPLIESLRRGVERLDRLCTMALASVGVLDSVDPGSAVPLNPRRLMLEVADELSDLDGRRRLMVQSPNEERAIGSHPRLLRPALSALVENALKFSPRSSPVEIVITIEAVETRISIRDFGDGMDPEMLGRAFDPFTQQDEGLSRRHGGMGIGLFAARRLLEQLHGELTITSQPGRGTEAAVILPTPELPAAKRLTII